MKEKEKKDLKEERRKKRESRWGKAEGRMASSRWEHDEREIDPGLPVAVAASVISIEELQIIQFRMRMQELTAMSTSSFRSVSVTAINRRVGV